MILSTEARTRTSKLDSNFTMYAALHNSKSQGSVLGISDYSNETQISGCLELGCTMSIVVTKTSETSCIVEWNYEGEFSYRADLDIKYIRVFEGDKQYLSEGSSLRIAKPSGSQ